jgi:hypothetical protein
VLSLIVASVPLLMLLVLLGGVSHAQVARVVGVTAASAFAAGSLGSTLALWREKTFQTLAMTALALALWALCGEALASPWWANATGLDSGSEWAAATTPLRAILAAAEPAAARGPLAPSLPWLGDAAVVFMLTAALAGVLLNLTAIARIRVWNPSRELQPVAADDATPTADVAARGDVHAAPGQAREVWDNPILWREVCTWAYGKRIVVVRLAYLLVAAACMAAVWSAWQRPDGPVGAFPPLAKPMIPLVVIGLLLVNALAVTSLTNERDLRALDLLLVTDLTPKEIVFG